jgi:uncharacterized membrane protein (DUF485 family)
MPEDDKGTDWHGIAARQDFKDLVRAKARFVVPATIFFVVYYFALPILVGYRSELMQTKVFGPVNLAYVFALSQFFMAWTLAFLYVRAASRWDAMEADILRTLERKDDG